MQKQCSLHSAMKTALAPHLKTESQGLVSQGGEREGIGANPAKRERLIFPLKEAKPNSSGPGGYERGREKEKSGPHVLVFPFWFGIGECWHGGTIQVGMGAAHGTDWEIFQTRRRPLGSCTQQGFA